jgi:hypothetical protein
MVRIEKFYIAIRIINRCVKIANFGVHPDTGSKSIDKNSFKALFQKWEMMINHGIGQTEEGDKDITRRGAGSP